MSSRLRHNFPIIKTRQYDCFMTTINTALCFDSNDKAKLKLHVITLLERTDWQTVKLAFPGISRATIYRWRKQFNDSNRKLSSLLPKSIRPHHTRQMAVPPQVLGFIKQLRKKYPRLSKYKIKPYLDIFCEEQQLDKYSVSWIGKVINRYSLFFNNRKPVKRRRKTKKVNRISLCPRQKDIKLGYLQVDGLHVWFEGRKYYFLSAIELKSRQSWAKRVPSLSSRQARIFLEEIVKQVPYQIHTVQTDNGSEFEGEFDQAIGRMSGVKHLWSYPRSLKTNGYVERFNWTIQDEFINYEVELLEFEPELFDQKLREWLRFYNTVRPHQSLGYKTPMQVLQSLLNLTPDCLKCV